MIGMLAWITGLTVFFLMYALLAPVRDTSKDEDKFIDLFDDDEDWENYEEQAPTDSIGKYVKPLLGSFLPSLPAIKLSEERKTSLNRLILKSDNPWKLTAEELVASMFGFAVIGFIFALIVVATGVLPEAVPPAVLLIAFPLMAGAMPYSKYNSTKEARTKAVEKELPEALDLLNITLRSGQVIEHALENVTKHLPSGLLKEEFTRVVVELHAGTTLERSLKNLNLRFDSEDLESFIKAVIQALRLGSDVSETLSRQADYVRSNYEARLQRMIARLESTMFIALTPTMLFAFMIILVGPTLSQLVGYL